MASIEQGTTRNLLLRAIDPDAFAAIAADAERVEVSEGERLSAAGSPLDAVWFPETALTSCVEVMADATRVEIGVVGYEGLAGWPVLLGCAVAPHDIVAQAGGGVAIRVPAPSLAGVCADHSAAAKVFLAYVDTLTVQLGRTAVSNLRDPVERRLARWLLMRHDRLEGDEIDLTHKAIAAMMGVRRAGVTDGLHSLEGQDVIRNRRGRIVIRDRPKLRRLAGESYGHPEAHYSRAISAFGK